MSEKRPLPVPVPANVTIDRRFLRRGKHTAIVALPEAFHALVGLVTVHWGSFEIIFNVCLDGLIVGEQTDGGTRKTEGWESATFRHRRELFKDICTDWLANSHPDEAKELCQIIDRCGDLRQQRDMLAHGRFSYTIPPYSGDATNCRAINPRTGKEMPFDDYSLRKLYHDIAHITADLVMAFKNIGEIEGDFLALPDEQLLQVFRTANRNHRATTDKL